MLVTLFSVLVSDIVFPVISVLVTVSFFAPLIQTSAFDKSTLSKYLSVTLKLRVAVLAGAFTVALIFSINGSTTSTTVADVPAFDVCATNCHQHISTYLFHHTHL